MINNLTTKHYRIQNAQRLIDDISQSNTYYLFAGDFLPHSNSSLQPVYDNTSNTLTDAYINMIFGKKISSNGVYLVINNNVWESNTVYTMYDDQDTDLADEQFYIITYEGSFYHVWKCIDNNMAIPSTVMPTFAYAASTPYYQTSDGYRWKYLTTVPNSIVSLFTLSNSFPIIANTTVQAAAIPGSIDNFKINGTGAFYNNYVSGVFSGADIFINGDQTLFNVANTTAQVNGFYTGCILYISDGTGQGQYVTITDYVSNTTGNLIQIERPFVFAPTNGSGFQITPQVEIVSGGRQTINCVARALVNSLASNSIYRIETLQTGQDYFQVLSSNVIANVVVGTVNNAIIRAIMPPHGGHGANVFNELYAHSVGISTTFSNNESNTIPTSNLYKQIGIIKEPQFTNVTLNLTGVIGSFSNGEEIFSYTSLQVAANATLTSGQSNVTCAGANFINQTNVGGQLIITNADASNSQLVTVNSIVNSSVITINSTGIFSCTASIIYTPTFTGNCVVTSGGSNPVVVNACSGTFVTGTHLIGSSFGATGIVVNITRSNIIKTFNTFVSLSKYDATLLSGAFIQNEMVTQGANAAYYFSSDPAGFMYFSNQVGGVFGPGIILGANSGAVANVTQSYPPEIVFGSGSLLYIENISPVTRLNNQKETFNLVLNF